MSYLKHKPYGNVKFVIFGVAKFKSVESVWKLEKGTVKSVQVFNVF